MGLNAMAISNRLSKLRMKAKELGVEPSASTESSKTVTKRAPAARKGNGKGHKPVGGMLGEDAQR